MNPEELEIMKEPKMQAFFKEKMEEWLDTDRFWYHACERVEPYSLYCCRAEHGEPFIIIPDPIDPVNPERGLWGMIIGIDKGVSGFEDTWEVAIVYGDSSKEYYYGDTPTLALLKALKAQVMG